MLKHRKMHDTVTKTSAVFKWGVKNAKEMETLCPYVKLRDEWNFTPVMQRFAPVFITLISPMLYRVNSRIAKHGISAVPQE